MDRSHHISRTQNRPLAPVVPLYCRASAALDVARIRVVFAGQDGQQAEATLCRMLEAIAGWLDQVEQGQIAAQGDLMAAAAGRIAELSGRVGFDELARAAGHLRDCAEHAPAAALSAVMARLQRAFDQTVAELWDIHDP
jgi:hypothetical protein